MNRLLPWAAAAIVAALLAWFVFPKILDRPSAPPPVTTVRPPPPKIPPAPPKPPLDFRVYRSRDEVVVFARTTEYGLPASDATVVLADAAGKELSTGRTDGTGVYRGSLPAGAATVSLRADGAEVWRDSPPAPAAPSDPPVLADRSVLRPGDLVGLAVRTSVSEAGLRVLLRASDGSTEDLGVPEEAEGISPGFPVPTSLCVRVPDDAAPGILIVESVGEPVLEIPLVARYGAATSGEDGPGGSPDPPPDPGAGGLALVDGEWRLPLPGREEGTAVLFLAEAGSRFLAHASFVPEGNEARAALAAAEGERVRIRAVAADPGGFREWEAVAPPAPKDPGSVDPVPPEEAPPAAPRVLVRQEDRVFGEEGTEYWCETDPIGESEALLRPWVPVEFPGRGETLAPDTVVRWSVRAPRVDSGSFRLRAGEAIALEARFSREEGANQAMPPGILLRPGGRQGSMSGDSLRGVPLLLETSTEGIEGVLLESMVVPPPKDAPAAGRRLSIERCIPDRARTGEVFEAGILLRAEAACGPITAVLPLPSGAVPAEDGWEVRRRSPPGTRVQMPPPPGRESHGLQLVAWRVPSLPAGETRLGVRVRLTLRGDLLSPRAEAVTFQDPSGPWARSGSGRIVVE